MSPGRRVEVESSGRIDAPLERLWDLVSDFSNLAHWHPDVTECRLESGSSRQAGAVRSSSSAQWNIDSAPAWGREGNATRCLFVTGAPSQLALSRNRFASRVLKSAHRFDVGVRTIAHASDAVFRECSYIGAFGHHNIDRQR